MVTQQERQEGHWSTVSQVANQELVEVKSHQFLICKYIKKQTNKMQKKCQKLIVDFSNKVVIKYPK